MRQGEDLLPRVEKEQCAMQMCHSSCAPFVRHASQGKRRRTAGSAVLARPFEPKDYGALSPCDGTQAGRGALAFGSDQQRLHRTVSAHTGVTASVLSHK